MSGLRSRAEPARQHRAARREPAYPAAALLLTGLLCVGCETSDSRALPTTDALRDTLSLARLLGSDPVPAAVAEVDVAVDEGKPVLAAELLAGGVLPAADRQLARTREFAPVSPEGTALAGRLIAAYGERRVALEAYRVALARGEVEDMQLVEALRAQRRAGEAILAVEADVNRIRGTTPNLNVR